MKRKIAGLLAAAMVIGSLSGVPAWGSVPAEGGAEIEALDEEGKNQGQEDREEEETGGSRKASPSNADETKPPHTQERDEDEEEEEDAGGQKASPSNADKASPSDAQKKPEGNAAEISESLLASREDIYGTDFAHRRAMAQSLLAACAETQLPAAAAMLLLNGRCVNLDVSGEVYFNYFLDFADYRESTTQAEYCQAVAERVFDLLSREWARSTGGQLPQYPRELVAFFKKAQVGGFSTIGAILTAVRAMPDRPQPPHRGARLLWDKILAGVAFVRRHSMAIFLAALVCVTVAYAAYQIGMRMFAGSAAQENTFYGGVQQIGEVSLTDENE